MKKRAGWLEALRGLGPLGVEAADYIESLKAAVTAANRARVAEKQEVETAERQVRDLSRENDRLKAQIAQLQSSPQ